MKISEREVYEAVTYKWQSTREIRDKIAEKKGKNKYNIPIAPIFIHGYKLVGEGFLEVNERKPKEEQAVARMGHSILEFRRIAGKKPDYGLDDMVMGMDDDPVIA